MSSRTDDVSRPASVAPPQRIAYSVRDFAAAVGLSRSRAYELIAAGEIPARRIHSRLVVRVVDAQAWVDGLPSAS